MSNIQENAEFDVDSFLAGLDADKTPERGPADRITKLLMNTRDNQGTVVLIPFMNKKSNNFYQKLSSVREWKGHTTKLDSGEAWYKILPIEMYDGLTEEETELYNEIVGYYDTISEMEVYDWNKLRWRSYSLIYGILMSHKDTSGDDIDDNVDKPCLFIFPSPSVIDAMSTAIAAKCQMMKGSKAWITAVLSPNNTGRKGVMSISFKKSNGAGYDASVAFDFNSDLNVIIDPARVFTEDETKYFNDPVRDLMGWQGSGDKYFNIEIMKELRDDLKLTLKELQKDGNTQEPEEKLENKNATSDPMKSEAGKEDSPKESAPASNGKKSDLPF